MELCKLCLTAHFSLLLRRSRYRLPFFFGILSVVSKRRQKEGYLRSFSLLGIKLGFFCPFLKKVGVPVEPTKIEVNIFFHKLEMFFRTLQKLRSPSCG